MALYGYFLLHPSGVSLQSLSQLGLGARKLQLRPNVEAFFSSLASLADPPQAWGSSEYCQSGSSEVQVFELARYLQVVIASDQSQVGLRLWLESFAAGIASLVTGITLSSMTAVQSKPCWCPRFELAQTCDGAYVGLQATLALPRSPRRLRQKAEFRVP